MIVRVRIMMKRLKMMNPVIMVRLQRVMMKRRRLKGQCLILCKTTKVLTT